MWRDRVGGRLDEVGRGAYQRHEGSSRTARPHAGDIERTAQLARSRPVDCRPSYTRGDVLHKSKAK